MSHRNILKNQSVKKLKKIHMKSILSEVKNKESIEEIDNSKKFNQSFNLHYKVNWKEGEKPKAFKQKRLQISQLQLHKGSQFSITKSPKIQSPIFESEKEKQESAIMSKKKMKTTQTARRSSKLQVQLNEIMKYSQLYPSRNSSQQIINSSLKRMTNQGLYAINKKSKFQNAFECIKGVRREDMILDLINFAVGDSEQDKSKRQSTKYLLRKSRQILSSCHRKKLDMSLTNIIQNEVAAIKLKKDRKTVGASHYRQQQYEPLDIRNESMHKFHQFLRGPDQEGREIENYLTSKQICIFQNKFDIYSKVYKKVKEGLNEEKIDISKIADLTVKNAIFLNESLIQSNQRSKKIQVQDIMKKFQFYN